jgi:hypothetical protein
MLTVLPVVSTPVRHRPVLISRTSVHSSVFVCGRECVASPVAHVSGRFPFHFIALSRQTPRVVRSRVYPVFLSSLPAAVDRTRTINQVAFVSSRCGCLPPNAQESRTDKFLSAEAARCRCSCSRGACFRLSQRFTCITRFVIHTHKQTNVLGS